MNKQQIRNFTDAKPTSKEVMKSLIKVDPTNTSILYKYETKSHENDHSQCQWTKCNALVKRHRVAKWIRKLNPTFPTCKNTSE